MAPRTRQIQADSSLALVLQLVSQMDEDEKDVVRQALGMVGEDAPTPLSKCERDGHKFPAKPFAFKKVRVKWRMENHAIFLCQQCGEERIASGD